MKKTMFFVALASLFCCGALEFDGVFQSHMVLQQGRTLAVSGKATPGERLTLDFAVSDVFDYLRQRIEQHDRSADYIILDPPAFTKSRRTVGNAKNGYLELNTLAMRLLPRGGFLATASCSHFMTVDMVYKMLLEAAKFL